MSTTRDTGFFSRHRARHGNRLALPVSILCSALLLSACGSSSDSNDDAPPPPVDNGGSQNEDNTGGVTGAEWPEINVQSDVPKRLRFSWTPVEGADHYRLMKNPGGTAGYEQVGENLSDPEAEDTIAVHLHDWHDTRYLVEACMDAECTQSEDSQEQITTTVMLDAIGYFKASNTSANDWFGWSLALSSDGETLAVSAPREASNARGIDGDQSDDSVFGAGAVYVFTLNDGQWQQQAYVKASNTEQEETRGLIGNDRFGYHLALSDNGDTLAVGAIGEDSDGAGVDPEDQDNNRAPYTGAVYLFQRTEETDEEGEPVRHWAQVGFFKASNATPAEDDGEFDQDDLAEEETPQEETPQEEEEGTGSPELPTNVGDRFGHRVALSGDGRTLAASSIYEASAATGIDGDESNNDAPAAGAVYVFTQGEDGWFQQAYVKASNSRSNNQFGNSLALSTDGNTLAVGSPGEPSADRGIEADQSRTGMPGTGAVYVFTRDEGNWSQEVYIKPSHTYTDIPQSWWRDGIGHMRFGTSVSISGDGSQLAVGAPGDLSASLGAEANPDDYDLQDGTTVAVDSGAVYLYARNGNDWAETAYLKPSNTHPGMRFGRELALSQDGQNLVVGAWRERSGETGINGDGLDVSVPRAGAAYLFQLNDGWAETAYIKSANTRSGQNFGVATSISGDGQTIAVGAHREGSGATGVNGDREDTSAEHSGAVYLY